MNEDEKQRCHQKSRLQKRVRTPEVIAQEDVGNGPINVANDCERTSARLTETFPTKGMTRERRPYKRQRGRREEEGNEERREWTDSVYRGKQLKREQRRRNAKRAEKTMRRRMTIPHVAYRWFALKAHTLTCPRLSYAVAETPSTALNESAVLGT